MDSVTSCLHVVIMKVAFGNRMSVQIKTRGVAGVAYLHVDASTWHVTAHEPKLEPINFGWQHMFKREMRRNELTFIQGWKFQKQFVSMAIEYGYTENEAKFMYAKLVCYKLLTKHPTIDTMKGAIKRIISPHKNCRYEMDSEHEQALIRDSLNFYIEQA